MDVKEVSIPPADPPLLHSWVRFTACIGVFTGEGVAYQRYFTSFTSTLHTLALSSPDRTMMDTEVTIDPPGTDCKSKQISEKIQEDETGLKDPCAPMQNGQSPKSSDGLGEKSGGPSLDGPPDQDDVVCDSCIESPRRAKKSCLTCLVSYCEDHLRPHLEKEKFQSHRLVEPLKDVERQTCEKHSSPLELYCCVDACCVCQECVSEQHQQHETLSITEARRKIEKELQDKQAETVKTLTVAENSINKLQSNLQSVQACVEELRAVVQQQVNTLQAVVQKVGAELSEVLKVEQKNTVGEVNAVQMQVGQSCAELKRTDSHLEKLCKNKNDLHFLQEYCQWKKNSPSVALPVVCMNQTDRLQAFSRIITHTTQELCSTILTTYRNALQESCTTENTSDPATGVQLSGVKQNLSLPEPESRDDFLKYASPLTFDCDTVHQFLRVTHDGRKLTNTTPWQHGYPEKPERFQHYKQALAAQNFSSGRHYFEADLGGAGVHVGVTYARMARQGEAKEACFTGSGVSWCVEWNGRAFSAWHGDVETVLSAPKATRVGIYVDFGCGAVAFYRVGLDAGMELMHRYGVELSEPLYPAVFLPKKENVVVLVEPGEELLLKSPSPPCSPP
ncbi:tripartite motif-containing protein 16-like [Trichomycterus rosablanca]|uniref:tripartite motif-containing protein 16-like n=1 Tax=Trichomycterus rosablanca TaxID=2290929 RepID=UPI002F35EAE7